jgi:hypothetical protein
MLIVLVVITFEDAPPRCRRKTPSLAVGDRPILSDRATSVKRSQPALSGSKALPAATARGHTDVVQGMTRVQTCLRRLIIVSPRVVEQAK